MNQRVKDGNEKNRMSKLSGPISEIGEVVIDFRVGK
jgi:hypothetical protein